jgi:hypothetical protein
LIGVQIHHKSPEQQYGLSEFFELFKTPWEMAVPRAKYEVIIVDNLESAAYGDQIILLQTDHEPEIVEEYKGKIGGKFDFVMGSWNQKPLLQLPSNLFQSVYEMLNFGLAEEEAAEPFIDLIIEEIKKFMAKGSCFVEVLAKPWGVPYSVALTHDVDHLSLREHVKDRVFYGRVRYGLRSVLKNYLGKPLGLTDEWRTWGEVSMQLVNSGIAALRVVFPILKDPWESFDKVIALEDGCGAESSSFYFAQKPGRGIVYNTNSPEYKRITRYVAQCGREVGVHSMDGWDDTSEAALEYANHASNFENTEFGTRVHWLYFGDRTWKNFTKAGFLYDTTFGFNKTVGFRAGTAQVYRPYNAEIWELPLHIQDGALFRRGYLSLRPKQANQRALETMAKSARLEAMCTLLWHVKSLSTEYTTWTETYRALLEQAQQDGAWMSSGLNIVKWFAQRREITFSTNANTLVISTCNQEIGRSFHVRIYSPNGTKDLELKGGNSLELAL